MVKEHKTFIFFMLADACKKAQNRENRGEKFLNIFHGFYIIFSSFLFSLRGHLEKMVPRLIPVFLAIKLYYSFTNLIKMVFAWS